MSTVVRRTFQSTPGRDASQTWGAVIDLLASNGGEEAREELQAVSGIVSSLIADQAPRTAAITVMCDGPRTRIYCLYDEDAIDGSDANEDPLGYNPLDGDWSISLPCHAEDLDWVQSALAKHSQRITARELSASVAEKSAQGSSPTGLVLDVQRFLGE